MARVPKELVVAGVLLATLGAAFWLVRRGPGVAALVGLAQDLLGALLS